MNQPEAEVIASAVAIMRPAWLKSSLMTLLSKLQHRPARQVALALVAMAYDEEIRTPGLLTDERGARFWAIAEMREPTYTPPAANEPLCPTHLDRQPCRGCRADQLAGTTTAASQQTQPLTPWRQIVAETEEEA